MSFSPLLIEQSQQCLWSSLFNSPSNQFVFLLHFLFSFLKPIFKNQNMPTYFAEYLKMSKQARSGGAQSNSALSSTSPVQCTLFRALHEFHDGALSGECPLLVWPFPAQFRTLHIQDFKSGMESPWNQIEVAPHFKLCPQTHRGF